MGESRVGKPLDLLASKRAATASSADEAAKAKAKADGRTTVEAGATLFQQGDAGGDLYFIEEGVVEIYTEKDGQTITLAEMKKGEIIGVVTCLTSEPRMASARAKTSVSCKRVPHANIKKVLNALPNWMKIVLKEFTVRLTDMNKQYSDAVIKIKNLEASQVSNVSYGALLASAFAATAEYLAVAQGNTKVVVIEDMLTKLPAMINLTKAEVEQIFAALLEAGLIKSETEPEKKRNIVTLENAQKLSFFAQFVRESKQGALRKLVRARFTTKELRTLTAIVKLAAQLGVDADKPCRLPLNEVARSLEQSGSMKFERAVLDKAVKLKLVTLEGGDGDAVVVLTPSTLGRTAACLDAVRRLTALDRRAGLSTDSASEAA